MKKGYQFLRALADSVDLRDEQLPGRPIVEIFDNTRVLVENHRGVKMYSTDLICAGMSFGILEIKGVKLELSSMTRDQLIVTGDITGVELIPGV